MLPNHMVQKILHFKLRMNFPNIINEKDKVKKTRRKKIKIGFFIYPIGLRIKEYA